MKRKGKTRLLVYITILLVILCGNSTMADETWGEEKATASNAIKSDVIQLADNSALRSAMIIEAGEDFEIEGTTLVKYIGNQKKVVVPEGIETIGERAFQDNNFVEEIKIPDSVTKIRKMAFAYALNLRRVEIGKGLRSTFTCMFAGTKSLEEVVVDSENFRFYSDEGVLRERGSSAIIWYPMGRKNKIYRIPEGISEVDFAWNPYIETIYVSESVTNLRLGGLYSLKDIIIDENNKNFRVVDGVLYNYDMTEILCYPSTKQGYRFIVPNTVTKIGEDVFSDICELEEIYFTQDPPGKNRDWYDLVYTHGIFKNPMKKYKLYFYNNSLWEELMEAYENKFGIGSRYFELEFHSFQKGYTISWEDEYAMLGKTTKLKIIKPELANGIVKEIVPGFWSVEDNINKIDENGIFTGYMEGIAKITAGGNELPYNITAEILVKKKAVSSIEIFEIFMDTYSGYKQTLSFAVLPDDAYDKSVKWYSTSPNTVRVDENGTITCIAEGEAEIYCVSTDGGVESNHCRVIVRSTVSGDNNENDNNGGDSNSGSVGSSSGSGSGNDESSSGSSNDGSSSGSGSSNDGSSSGSSNDGSSSGGGNSNVGSSSVGSGENSSSSGSAGKATLNKIGSDSTADSLPLYIVKGTWNRLADNGWGFSDLLGNRICNAWAAVENPYANLSIGQQGFDWFRFDESGKMLTGWYYDSTDGYWYYLNPVSDNTLGRMITGWHIVDGEYYYFNPNSDGHRGRMYINEQTPDGYWVDENGRWN